MAAAHQFALVDNHLLPDCFHISYLDYFYQTLTLVRIWVLSDYHDGHSNGCHKSVCICGHSNIAAYHTSSSKSNIHITLIKVSKGAKIRNRYNKVPHLTQDTNGKVTNSQLDTTNKSQKVSPFPAGDHKAQINRRVQRHNTHKTEKHKRSTKEVPPWNGQ